MVTTAAAAPAPAPAFAYGPQRWLHSRLARGRGARAAVLARRARARAEPVIRGIGGAARPVVPVVARRAVLVRGDTGGGRRSDAASHLPLHIFFKICQRRHLLEGRRAVARHRHALRPAYGIAALPDRAAEHPLHPAAGARRPRCVGEAVACCAHGVRRGALHAAVLPARAQAAQPCAGVALELTSRAHAARRAVRRKAKAGACDAAAVARGVANCAGAE